MSQPSFSHGPLKGDFLEASQLLFELYMLTFKTNPIINDFTTLVKRWNLV
jgi:hypothetical protein